MKKKQLLSLLSGALLFVACSNSTSPVTNPNRALIGTWYEPDTLWRLPLNGDGHAYRFTLFIDDSGSKGLFLHDSEYLYRYTDTGFTMIGAYYVTPKDYNLDTATVGIFWNPERSAGLKLQNDSLVGKLIDGYGRPLIFVKQ